MKQIKKEIKEVVLEEGDFGIIYKCLQYVTHRQVSHSKAFHIDSIKLNSLLMQMNRYKE